MMRILLTVLLSLLLLSVANAQTKYQYGISTAISLAKINPSGNTATKNRYGQQACINVVWESGKKRSYRAGLGYSYLRAENFLHRAFVSDNITTRYEHHDILIPLQLQYGFSSKPNRLYLAAGILTSINIKRKVTEITDFPYSTAILERDITKEQHYTRLDGFITLGLGYEFKLKSGARFFVQPSFRSNTITQFVYLLEYLTDQRGYNDDNEPPTVRVIGIELGYYL